MSTSPPHTPPAPPAPRPTFGIRFQLSTVLLLSTLNGIGLAALLGVLFLRIQPDVLVIFPGARWALAWVIGVAVTTVFMALRLQYVLSNPLAELSAGAAQVAAGDLDAEIPQPAGRRRAPEILDLAQSVDAMRQALVRSIQSLDARQEELATLLANLDEGVLVLDREGRIVSASPRVRELLARRRGGVPEPEPGVALTRLLPELGEISADPDDAPPKEIELATERGTPRWLSVRLRPLRGPNAAGARVVVLRDVTREREVEDLKREFLSVVTHELKTPLTSIEGYAKLLLMGKGGPLTDRQRVFTATITDQTATLQTLIQNLLDITRLEGGNLPLEPSLVDPAELAREAAERLRATAETRGLRLDCQVDVPPGVTLHVDAFRIHQVLGNLLSNAVKFTPEGGTITVSAAVRGGAVELAVADTGRGIPAEALPHLFEKFYQVAKGDRRIAGGAGLGLYICRALVERQGGTLTATSTEGEGSRFVLRFDAVTAGTGGSSREG